MDLLGPQWDASFRYLHWAVPFDGFGGSAAGCLFRLSLLVLAFGGLGGPAVKCLFRLSSLVFAFEGSLDQDLGPTPFHEAQP